MTNAFSPAFKSAIDWSKDQTSIRKSEGASKSREDRLASENPIVRKKAETIVPGPLSKKEHDFDMAKYVRMKKNSKLG